MNQSDLEKDLRSFMNAQSAHHLILRALLRSNPDVCEQLRGFLSGMQPSNADEAQVIQDAMSLLPKTK